MMEFIVNLLELALIETALEPEQVQEAVIESSLDRWTVYLQPSNQEVFFMERDGLQFAYHVNCYDDEPYYSRADEMADQANADYYDEVARGGQVA